MPDPGCICDLHCSLWQHWILNPQREARDWTCILTDTSQVHNPLSHDGNSPCSDLEDCPRLTVKWQEWVSEHRTLCAAGPYSGKCAHTHKHTNNTDTDKYSQLTRAALWVELGGNQWGYLSTCIADVNKDRSLVLLIWLKINFKKEKEKRNVGLSKF